MGSNDVVILIAAEGLGLFFLLSGIRGLLLGRMGTANPDTPSVWPDLAGVCFFLTRRSMTWQDHPLRKEGRIVRPRLSVRRKAWLHILLGTACAGTGLLHLANLLLPHQTG